MKRFASLVLVVALFSFSGLFLSTSPATADSGYQPPTAFALPDCFDVRYPDLVVPNLDARKAATMGLHPVVLKVLTVVYNYDKTRKRFERELLLPGTLAWADAQGRLVYKADCGNRIVQIEPCPVCASVGPNLRLPNSPSSLSPSSPDTNKKDPSFFGGAGGSGSDAGGGSSGFWNFLKNLGMILLGIVLLLFALWAIAELIRWIWDRWNRRSSTPTAPITPAPPTTPTAPTPTLVSPPAVAPLVAPTPIAPPAPTPSTPPNSPVHIVVYRPANGSLSEYVYYDGPGEVISRITLPDGTHVVTVSAD